MALRMSLVPVRSRDSFFRDEFFADCREVMERHKKEFEQKCAENRSSRDSLSGKKLSSVDHRRPLFDDYSLSSKIHPHPASLMMLDSDYLARMYASGLGIHSDQDNFKVSLDVQQFGPEELTVKTVDSTIVIEGKHEEKEDPHGLVSRHFQRKYTLPTDVKVEHVQCSFTPDGRLHITAPRRGPPPLTETQQKSENTQSSILQDMEKKYEKKFKEASLADSLKDDLKQAKKEYEKSVEEILEKRAERKNAFNSEVRKAREEFDKSASLFSRERDEFKHSRLLRMFEPHFTAFPEFDPLPFWKRGQTSILASEFDKKSSIFDDFAGAGRFGKNSFSDHSTSSPSSKEFQQDSENFKVIVDVHEFKPEELHVKTYDYFVEIEAKHEAKEDPHGFIKREFKRKYTLPRDVKATEVQCNLSSEGILVVTAPRRKPEEIGANPQTVPIIQKKASVDRPGTTNEQTHQSSIQKTAGDYTFPMEPEPKEKVYQNVSTVHQIFTEKQGISPTTVNGNDRPAASEVKTEPYSKLNFNSGERVIPIDQESSASADVRVEFPESRPESSASSIPFDFSRGKSEEPVSVASSVPPTFESLAPATAGSERIIKIQIAN